MSKAETGTIETSIPSRIDRLPWSKFHWLVVIGLGAVWILDGLEVTIVGSIASRLTEHGSGIHMTSGQIGTAAAFYVGGACCGALLFGQLTDRFGRKKLFLITLAVYVLATGATAFAMTPLYFFIARFVTGMGIGGEYAAINSAIDELIPARVRGRVDLIINGSYWLGSAGGSAAALLFLSTSIFAKDLGWRLAFGMGVVLGVGILFVRRNVPESPRWLFIHGREDEAEQIVSSVESDIERETGQQLDEPEDTLQIRQRERIPFRTIARTAFKVYPKRAILGLALFVGQAFIYNGVTFNLGTLFTTFEHVSSSAVPIFIIIFAIANFLGPLTLGRLFDTVGRKPMIAGTYLGSAAIAAVLAFVFAGGSLTKWTLEAFIVATFFLASAGASAAYLTVSEIFPMETRALAIAFFYAVGTGIGGIAGPLLFGRLIGSHERGQVEIAFLIGAAVMAVGGIAELFFGVKAEQAKLEDIAKPLTAEDAEGGAPGDDGQAARGAVLESKVLDYRAQAEAERTRAAEHRARLHELLANRSDRGEAQPELDTHDALAAIGDLRAQALDKRADAIEARAAADAADGDAQRRRCEALVAAADAWADCFDEQALAAGADSDEDEDRHAELAGRARERALAAEAQAEVALHDLRAAEAHSQAEDKAQAAEQQEREQRARRRAREREARIRDRIERRARRESHGLRRFRPGPGSVTASPGMGLPRTREDADALEREVGAIVAAVEENGAMSRHDLARMVGARYWGPGRFQQAIREAVAAGEVQRDGTRIAPGE